MKKFLLILLPIVSLLLGVGGKAHAHWSAKDFGLNPQANVSSDEALAEYSQSFIVNSSSSGTGKSIDIDLAENEIEEHKLIPSKKEFAGTDYSWSVFWVLIAGYYSSFLKRSFTLKEYLNFSPSPRKFILLQVFRL